MALYEHIFMVRQDLSGQQAEELIEQYKGVLEGGGATVVKQEYWGVKSLAYRIRKNRKAHFVLLEIAGPHAAIAEVERQMRINEDVLRFITVKVDAHEEGPSIMLQKRERDERRDRERGDRGERGGDRGDRGDRFEGERRPRRDRDDAQPAL